MEFHVVASVNCLKSHIFAKGIIRLYGLRAIYRTIIWNDAHYFIIVPDYMTTFIFFITFLNRITADKLMSENKVKRDIIARHLAGRNDIIRHYIIQISMNSMIHVVLFYHLFSKLFMSKWFRIGLNILLNKNYF